MKARVFVSLKASVLDPQGQAIQKALQRHGHAGVANVRQGKYFDVTLDAALDREQARRELERIARDVLANTVIEDYRVEVVD